MDLLNKRTVQDIPEQFRPLFAAYPEFNPVQSAVFPDLMETNDSIVVTAPTGSGKTVLFELAVVKLLMDNPSFNKVKAVYVAPVKALCSERFTDWNTKFEQFGLSCIEVTGDSMEEIDLRNYQLILTTPEKWDSLTRQWRDNVSFVNMVKLMLIDEVHLLSDKTRGPTLETIVCRMKTTGSQIRFIAVSATIFNLEDLAEWFGNGNSPARMHRFGNEMRPVALQRIVKSYPNNTSLFLFDMQLSYKLKDILLEYSEGKPSLIFCSTRRGVVQTCKTLSEMLKFQFATKELEELAPRITDKDLRDYFKKGIGYHHAGVVTEDRHLIQDVFSRGLLKILVATTTLAMGVNLPAHLVIIKSTHHYVGGRYCEYPESFVLQMVGRAGRPQFDTHATAVIMTRNELAQKYQNLLDCKEIMESSLHHHLAEHLNSEIVLRTITDLGIAMDWLRCTFLHQRALKNPKHYGLNFSNIDKELEMMVLKEVNALHKAELVELIDGMDISATPNGRLMSRYYLSVKTFQIFQEINAKMSMTDLLSLLSAAHEFNEIQLRVSEKRVLNSLNSSNTCEIIRYPMKGKIKTREMKINCLAQAIMGCLPIPDSSLQQEAVRIVNLMERVTKCLVEYLSRKPHYLPFHNAVLLNKCLHSKLWENSRYVARQLDRIGPVLGASLVSSGKTRFDVLIQSHPCELERIVNRGPPFGSHLIDQARRLPHYELSVQINQDSVLTSTVVVGIEIGNASLVSERNTAGKHHAIIAIVGDTNNRLLHQRRVPDSTILQGGFTFSVFVAAPQPKKIFVKIVSEQWAGIDVNFEDHVDFMAKDMLADDAFVESRQKNPKKRVTKKTGSSVVEKPVKKKKGNQAVSSTTLTKCCFDVEPDWQDFKQYVKQSVIEDLQESSADCGKPELVVLENSINFGVSFDMESIEKDDLNGHWKHFNESPEIINNNIFQKENTPERGIFFHHSLCKISQKCNDEPRQVVEISTPCQMTEIIEQASFDVYDSEELLKNIEPAADQCEKINHSTIDAKNTKDIFIISGEEAIQMNAPGSPKLPFYPGDVQWPSFCPETRVKENMMPKRVETVGAIAKPLNTLKTLKDFYPLVKTVRNLSVTGYDEKLMNLFE